MALDQLGSTSRTPRSRSSRTRRRACSAVCAPRRRYAHAFAPRRRARRSTGATGGAVTAAGATAIVAVPARAAAVAEVANESLPGWEPPTAGRARAPRPNARVADRHRDDDTSSDTAGQRRSGSGAGGGAGGNRRRRRNRPSPSAEGAAVSENTQSTDESATSEMDLEAQRVAVEGFLTELLVAFGRSDATVTVEVGEDEALEASVEGSELGLLVGQKGVTLRRSRSSSAAWCSVVSSGSPTLGCGSTWPATAPVARRRWPASPPTIAESRQGVGRGQGAGSRWARPTARSCTTRQRHRRRRHRVRGRGRRPSGGHPPGVSRRRIGRWAAT